MGKHERYKWDLIARTEIRRSNGAAVVLGSVNVADVTRHDIQAFIDVQRPAKVVDVGLNKSGRRGGLQKRGGIVSTNRCLGRLRAFYNWAAVNGHVEATPFKKGGVCRIDIPASSPHGSGQLIWLATPRMLRKTT